MKQFIFTIILFLPLASFGVINLTPTEELKIDSLPLLIATHASVTWHESRSIKNKINRLIDDSKGRSYNIIYLVGRLSGTNGDRSSEYFVSHESYDYAITSRSGEFKFDIDNSKVILSGGGYFECLLKTFKDLVINNKAQNYSVLLPTRSIYATSSESLYEIMNWSSLEFKKRIILNQKWISTLESINNTHIQIFYENELIFEKNPDSYKEIKLIYSACKKNCYKKL